MSVIVVDANIVAKLFADEHDSLEAVAFLRKCVAKHIKVVAPDLVKYELLQIAVKKNFPVSEVIDLFDRHISTIVNQVIPSNPVWLQAETISQDGHEKSGFPSMYDSVYHAMAIVLDGVFVTADKRHYEKAKQYGHISLLQDWHKLF